MYVKIEPLDNPTHRITTANFHKLQSKFVKNRKCTLR